MSNSIPQLLSHELTHARVSCKTYFISSRRIQWNTTHIMFLTCIYKQCIPSKRYSKFSVSPRPLGQRGHHGGSYSAKQ